MLLRQPVSASLGDYLDGEFVLPPGPDGEIRSVSPADDDDLIGVYPWALGHANEAVAAAQRALPAWRLRPLGERISMVKAFAEAVRARRDVLAMAIARSIGKPVWEALTEVDAVVAKIGITVGAGLDAIAPRSLPSDKAFVRYRPVGVMVVLGPFNFPAHLPNGHFIPALVTGNTVVFKPSERAPQVGEILALCMHEAGLPPGVFNLVQGDGRVAQCLVENAAVHGVCFTGSTAVGRRILQASAAYPGRMIALELGGSNGAIVTADANIQHAAREIAFSAFVTAGQRCTATSRVFVERAASDALVSELLRLTTQLRVGHPGAPAVFMGPVINAASRSRALEAAKALAASHEAVLAPSEIGVDGVIGAYMSPGIFLASKASGVAGEEFFAPLLVVELVDDDAAAVAALNATPYGLAAGVFCASEDRFERLAAELDVGICNWNRGTVGSSSKLPFGGVKASGNHRPAGLASTLYCVDAVAQIRWPEPPPPAALPGFPL